MKKRVSISGAGFLGFHQPVSSMKPKYRCYQKTKALLIYSSMKQTNGKASAWPRVMMVLPQNHMIYQKTTWTQSGENMPGSFLLREGIFSHSFTYICE